MIEINLVPEELRQRVKKEAKAAETKKLLYLLPVFFGILIIAHLYLAVNLIINNNQLRKLNSRLRQLEPQKRAMEGLRKEYASSSSDMQLMQQLTAEKIDWAEKLNRLSLNLPSAVWFEEMSLSNKEFILKGSAVSLRKEEVTIINRLLTNLKGDTAFFKDFVSLELSSLQVRIIGGQEVVDFVLRGTLK